MDVLRAATFQVWGELAVGDSINASVLMNTLNRRITNKEPALLIRDARRFPISTLDTSSVLHVWGRDFAGLQVLIPAQTNP